MLRWKVEPGPRFHRDLRKLDRAGRRDIVVRILASLRAFGNEPFDRRSRLDLQPLSGGNRERYRLRVGGYRVLLTVDRDARTVSVTRVLSREHAYD